MVERDSLSINVTVAVPESVVEPGGNRCAPTGGGDLRQTLVAERSTDGQTIIPQEASTRIHPLRIYVVVVAHHAGGVFGAVFPGDDRPTRPVRTDACIDLAPRGRADRDAYRGPQQRPAGGDPLCVNIVLAAPEWCAGVVPRDDRAARTVRSKRAPILHEARGGRERQAVCCPPRCAAGIDALSVDDVRLTIDPVGPRDDRATCAVRNGRG